MTANKTGNVSVQKPRFLLIGIGGVYNYGCEAIVRGTEILLRERWPDAKIVYASPRPEDDRRRLGGTDVEIIRRKVHGKYSPRNICRKLLSCAGVRWHPNMDSMSMTDGIDAVLSIGGDIYTLSGNGYYAQPLMSFGDAVRRKRKHYVLWGASVGPFREAPRIEKEVQLHLKRVGLISARENETVDYLNRLGITENVVSCADPAYAVAPQIQHTPRRHGASTIGLNLSPLSIQHCGLEAATAVRQHAGAIERLIQHAGCRVLLIPHVVCDFAHSDDDLRYLAKIKAALPAPVRQRCELLDVDAGFVATKKELVNCDLVIAARMHCAINAMAAAVPTILLSYSRKALGMGQYVYGSAQWVLPVQELASEKMLNVVCRMLENKHAVSSALARRMPAVRADTRAPISVLEKTLGGFPELRKAVQKHHAN